MYNCKSILCTSAIQVDLDLVDDSQTYGSKTRSNFSEGQFEFFHFYSRSFKIFLNFFIACLVSSRWSAKSNCPCLCKNSRSQLRNCWLFRLERVLRIHKVFASHSQYLERVMFLGLRPLYPDFGHQGCDSPSLKRCTDVAVRLRIQRDPD